MNLQEKSEKIKELDEAIRKMRKEVYGDMGVRGRANIASNVQYELQAKETKLSEACLIILEQLGIDDGSKAIVVLQEKRGVLKKRIDELAKKAEEAEKVAKDAEEKIRSMEEEKRTLERVGPYCPHCGKPVVETTYPWP